MGAQVVEGFSKAPASRVRVDDGGWLALTGEPLADLNMGGIMAGSSAPALLEDYVAEAGELPAVLRVEQPTTDLLERAQQLGAQHVGEIPLMVWEDRSFDGRTGELDVHPAATPERHQRQGIGRAVLQGIMGHHLAHGVSRFYLGATEAGFRLYEQLHYQVVATPSALLIGSSTQFA